MRNSYFALFFWMFELTMITSRMVKNPAVIFQPFDNFSAFHNMCIIHTVLNNIKGKVNYLLGIFEANVELSCLGF